MTSAAAAAHGEPVDAFRWPVCALVVLALHATGLIALVAWRAQPMPAEPASVPLMMDLAPAPAPAPPPPPVATIVEPEPPEILIVLPEVTPIKEPEIVVPPPKPKPVPRKPPPQRIEKSPGPPPPQAVVEAPSSAPASAAAAQPAPAASSGAPPSADAVTNFQRLLMVQLNRAKRYPVAAQRRHAQGVAYLRFTMDRGGRVLAAQLERSSGHGDLDAEVLALIKRAEPLPSFPPEMTQARLELVVPVQFSLR